MGKGKVRGRMTNGNPSRPPLKRKYLVNKPYQIGFIAMLCAPVILMGIFSGAVIYHTAQGVLAESLYRTHLASGNVGKVLETPMIQANAKLFALSCLLGLGAVLIIGRRASSAIRLIADRVREFAGTHAEQLPPARSSLWAGIESQALREFRGRLRGFARAEARLAETIDFFDANESQTQYPRRNELLDKLRAIETDCRVALGKFRLE